MTYFVLTLMCMFLCACESWFLALKEKCTSNWKASKTRVPRIIFGRMSDTQIEDQWLPVARLEMSGAVCPLHPLTVRKGIHLRITVGLSSDRRSSPKATHLFLHATPTCRLSIVNYVMDTQQILFILHSLLFHISKPFTLQPSIIYRVMRSLRWR